MPIFSGIPILDDPEKLTPEQRRAICKVADRMRFRPYSETYRNMTEEEREDLRGKLAYYRELRCHKIDHEWRTEAEPA